MRRSTHLGITLASVVCLAGSVAKADIVIGNYSAGIGTGTLFGTSSTTIYKTVGWIMPPGEDYLLDEIVLSLNFGGGGTGIVSIWSGAASPAQRLFNLDGPPQVGSGDFVFTPPSSFTMEAGQSYWLYVESIPSPVGNFLWNGTSPSTQPSGVATSLGYIFNGNPSNFLNRFEVRGTAASAGCYANCDTSTTPPILNVDDFTCFINEFAGAQGLSHQQQVTHYANCDGSTVVPALNVDDFTCFINEFAQGCP